MKQFIFFAHALTWCALALPQSLPAQDSLNTYPNYVVIGAFAVHKNAVNFTGDASRSRYPARFEMNYNRNLYYVYVLATKDRQRAIDEALRLRADTKYFDTWVYSGPIGTNAVLPGIRGTDVHPETGRAFSYVGDQPTDGSLGQRATVSSGVVEDGTNRTEQIRVDDAALVRTSNNDPVNASADVRAGTGTDLMPGQSRDAAIGNTSTSEEESTPVPASYPVRASTEPLTTEDVAGKDFYFHLFRADNGFTVDGEVDAIDFERSRKMATYPANTSVHVAIPSTNSRQVSLVCQVFGYRKHQVEFDPANPSPEFFLDDKGNLVVPFELMRLQKGDVAIMYNVFFFKDAAVMRPESRYEVNNLLELLEENPSYRIVIHGHTNGNASGKIIRMDTPDNFYSLSGTKQGYGSAKELSEERGEVMRQFLINSGISADRMQVKAWGGKKPIHDRNSPRANENVRVEIEILRD